MMITPNSDTEKEGHVKEWQDRARVVVDAKQKVQENASPNQSPQPDIPVEDAEEKNRPLHNEGSSSY